MNLFFLEYFDLFFYSLAASYELKTASPCYDLPLQSNFKQSISSSGLESCLGSACAFRLKRGLLVNVNFRCLHIEMVWGIIFLKVRSVELVAVE